MLILVSSMGSTSRAPAGAAGASAAAGAGTGGASTRCAGGASTRGAGGASAATRCPTTVASSSATRHPIERMLRRRRARRGRRRDGDLRRGPGCVVLRDAGDERDAAARRRRARTRRAAATPGGAPWPGGADGAGGTAGAAGAAVATAGVPAAAAAVDGAAAAPTAPVAAGAAFGRRAGTDPGPVARASVISEPDDLVVPALEAAGAVEQRREVADHDRAREPEDDVAQQRPAEAERRLVAGRDQAQPLRAHADRAGAAPA